MTQPFKICPQCQEPVAVNAASCAKCGLPYHTAAPPIVPPLPPDPRALAAGSSPEPRVSTPIRKGISDRGKVVLAVVAAFVLLVPMAILYSYVDEMSVNSIAKGILDGRSRSAEEFDTSCFPLGPETRKAYALVAVNQPQEETAAKLGAPTLIIPREDPYTYHVYAYRDGWLEVFTRNGRVWGVHAFGPYSNPDAYPPVQAERAKQCGKPIGTDWRHLINTKPPTRE